MIDDVIVTVATENQDFSVDMELPAQLPFNELTPKLLETLKEFDADRFGNTEELTLMYNEAVLSGDATLESEAVWDGSILIVRVKHVSH